MKTKYLMLDIFLITSLLVLAVVINVSFSHILENNIKMSEITRANNELVYNDSTKPIYNDVTGETHRTIEYTEGKSYGIDVSAWQGKIDWAKVKQSGTEFAIIRVGFRGYEKGDINIDKYFYTNMNGALANGIKVGVYFYSAAKNEKEAIDEAKFVEDKIEPYRNLITYPVVFDLEKINLDRLTGISGTQVTKNAIAFLDHIQNAGYTPMFYTGIIHTRIAWHMDKLEKYPIWLADYVDKTNYQGKYDMWQYTSSGKVKGISGRVDLNVANFKVLVSENDIANDKVIQNMKFNKVNDTVTVTTFANFRKSPTAELENKITDSIPAGTKLKRLAVSEDGLWSKVIYKDNVGYIFSNYVTNKPKMI